MALNRRDARLQHVQEQSLGTVFTDNKFEYGIVVLNISDLDDVRHGIVGFEIKSMAEVDVTWTGDWDRAENCSLVKDAVPVLEEDRRRVPLTAAKYMKKFLRRYEGEIPRALNRRSIISMDALICTCPIPSSNPVL